MDSIFSSTSSVLISEGTAISGSNRYASRCAGTSRMTSGRTSWLLVIDLQDATPKIRVASIVVISTDVFLSLLLLKKQREMVLFLRCFLHAAGFLVAGDSINSIRASWLIIAG